MSWTIFPTEIKQQILEHVRDFKCRLYDSPIVRSLQRQAKGVSQALYASVCWEWNHFFEAANFRRLILHQDDIDTFGHLILKGRKQRPRAEDVRWVWLRLELPTYDCPRCDEPESQKEVRVNEKILTRSVRKLFNILKRFDKSHPGVTFELSADSPSLSRHYSQELGSIARDTAWEVAGGRNVSRSLLHDPLHSWENGYRAPMAIYAAMRITGKAPGLCFAQRHIPRLAELSKVSVIKAFMIRAQCYRHFAVRQGLEHIIKACPELRELAYETWKGLSTEQFPGQPLRVWEWEHLISDTFKNRRNLRKVSLFEGASRCNPNGNASIWTWDDPAVGLGVALAERSRDLEELYVNNLVDANEFFREFRGDVPTVKSDNMRWENLRCVSLFTQLLCREGFEDQIRIAGRGASNMPQLEFMELWYTGREWQCIFTYRTSQHLHDTHKLRLRSSWGGRLDPGTVAVWRKAVGHRGGGMGVEVVRPERSFKFPKGRDEFCALVLKGDVLTWATRRQIANRSTHKNSTFS